MERFSRGGETNLDGCMPVCWQQLAAANPRPLRCLLCGGLQVTAMARCCGASCCQSAGAYVRIAGRAQQHGAGQASSSWAHECGIDIKGAVPQRANIAYRTLKSREWHHRARPIGPAHAALASFAVATKVLPATWAILPAHVARTSSVYYIVCVIRAHARCGGGGMLSTRRM